MGLPRRPLAIGWASGSCNDTIRVDPSGVSPARRWRADASEHAPTHSTLPRRSSGALPRLKAVGRLAPPHSLHEVGFGQVNELPYNMPIAVALANLREPVRHVDYLAIGARRLVAEAQLVVGQRSVSRELATQHLIQAPQAGLD